MIYLFQNFGLIENQSIEENLLWSHWSKVESGYGTAVEAEAGFLEGRPGLST